tara:strand:- start:336 stop:533 length:198 start_codon:yes stop_codon:yes gene_type:complete
MSAQVRLEALKLAIGMGERDNPLTLASQFEAYITGGTIAPNLEIVQNIIEDTPQENRRHRRKKGR